MPMQVAVGHAFSVEGREAVARAVYKARLILGNVRVSFAVVVASFEYDFNAVFSAAQTQIGDVPMIGFSTSGEFDQRGSHRRAVVVALISDDDLDAKADWLPGFGESSQQITRRLVKDLGLTSEQQGLLLLMADGIHGDYETLVNTLPTGRYRVGGGLSGGDIHLDHTYQLGGNKAGAGGLAAALLSGSHLVFGVGAGHGWHPVGAKCRISGVYGPWVRSLDEKPAFERYAELFGREPRDWAFPPLNTLVRLYPLGIERDGQPLLVRAPLRMEADGSLRMHAALTQGDTGELLIGSRDQCLRSARQAASDALEMTAGATPRLALVLADISWQMMFQGYEGAEIEAVQSVLGDDVPLIGGYTFGQFHQMSRAPRAEFLNQVLQVIVFAEK